MKIKKRLFTYIYFVLLLHIILVPAAGAANKLMPLGDSITRGFTGSTIRAGYREELYLNLDGDGYDFDFVGGRSDGVPAVVDKDHEGHSGWRADEIVDGRIGLPEEGQLDEWLITEEPNIVLLHIGTNDISAEIEHYSKVEDILVVIDDYEFASGKAVWVILSLIVDRSCDLLDSDCLTKSDNTTAFNNDVRDFVFFPRQAGADKILLVDMQNGAGINYDRWDMDGDMWDDVHPFETGYAKMADLWYTRLMEILPQADAGTDQDVNEFDTVMLDASGSSDPKLGTLTYQWVQTAGTPVVLSDDQAVQPTFNAPIVGPGETLTFKVTVTDTDSLESTDTININILNGTAKDFLYTPVTPCRIVDTRNTSAGIIGASTQRNFQVHGSGGTINAQGGNPAGCFSPMGEPFAVHINMVAVNPTGKGNLQAFPVGAGTGAGLSVNYNTIDTNLANAGTVKSITGTGPDITVASNFSSAHTVIDVLGYYYPDGDLLYTPVTPCRIIDTRSTSAGIIGASTQRNFDVFGSAGTISDQGGNPVGCPSPLGEPLAAHINMIAVYPTGKGNLQAFPVDAGTGAGLSVNYNTIDTNLANAGTVKTVTGAGADITVASNFSSAHTVIDVLGYYYPDGDLLYTPVTPCRIIDTRKTSAGIIGASTQRNFDVFGSSGTISAQGGNPVGCPSPLGEPLAAHINMVAVNPTGKGNLQAFPVGAGTGAGLSVNYNTIDTNLANAGTVKTVTGAGADITVASNFSSAQTVIDVLGYYYPAP